MPPSRPLRPTGVPGLDWMTTDDGSLTIWDQRLQETYHSGCGAIAESLVVYLSNSGVLSRLADRIPTQVFEIGLGTGTSLMLTASLAEYFETSLDYWVADKHLLSPTLCAGLNLLHTLPRALAENQTNLFAPETFHSMRPQSSRSGSETITLDTFRWLPLISDAFTQCIGQIIAADPAVQWQPTDEDSDQVDLEHEVIQQRSCTLTQHVRIHLLVGNAVHLPELPLMADLTDRIDAVYFDPFSPETNPELWSNPILGSMHSILCPEGILTSYCVKSQVRRMLEEIGFCVRKVAGPFGGKREVLQAVKNSPG